METPKAKIKTGAPTLPNSIQILQNLAIGNLYIFWIFPKSMSKYESDTTSLTGPPIIYYGSLSVILVANSSFTKLAYDLMDMPLFTLSI